LYMLKTSQESLQLQVTASLKTAGKRFSLWSHFPLGGKIQVIRRRSGGQAIKTVRCQCKLLLTMLHHLDRGTLWTLTVGLLPQQVLSLFDKQGSDGVGKEST
jgi:hypothetical protein